MKSSNYLQSLNEHGNILSFQNWSGAVTISISAASPVVAGDVSSNESS